MPNTEISAFIWIMTPCNAIVSSTDYGARLTGFGSQFRSPAM